MVKQAKLNRGLISVFASLRRNFINCSQISPSGPQGAKTLTAAITATKFTWRNKRHVKKSAQNNRLMRRKNPNRKLSKRDVAAN